MATFQAPRGTTDILPDVQPYWRLVDETARRVAEVRGYERLDTPIFEATRLFVRGVGEGTDIVEKEMYSFQDKGGDDLTLRPEATAALCRAYLEHGLSNQPQPVKLYTLGPFFRHDKPQAGRYRQFHQFNCEAIGEIDPAVDAEIIDVAWQFYAALGLRDLSLALNSIGCPVCRPRYLDALRQYYRERFSDLCPDCQGRLERNPLRLLDCKNPRCQPLMAGAPNTTDYLCAECAGHFAGVKHYLGLHEIPYAIDNRLVRGLDYYTKTVFEVHPAVTGGQSAIGGGGRYDGLIEQLGGRPTPAVGFATGIERIILNLQAQQVEPPAPERAPAFIVHRGEGSADVAWRLADQLRRAGLPVLVGFGGRSIKAQMRNANARDAGWAIIIGEDEAQSGQATVRDLRHGNEEKVAQDSLVDYLRDRPG